MFKNFSPQSLGINGRQSELIELALTYAFRGMDVDMGDMFRRSQRTTVEDATKYLHAADIKIGGFRVEVDLDADDDAFTSQVGTLHPQVDLAADLKVERAYIYVPAATDRLPYHEYFDIQRNRLTQVADVLAAKGIKLGIGFNAGKEHGEGKEFPFVNTVEGFLALVKAVTADNAGFMIDTWDWVVGGGAMDQISELTSDQIIAVRLGSVPEDVDIASAVSTDRDIPELEGVMNHVNLVKHLEAIEFEGPISPTASATRYKGQTRESIVQKCQEAIDAISTEAGLHVAPRPMDLIEDIPYEPTPVI